MGRIKLLNLHKATSIFDLAKALLDDTALDIKPLFIVVLVTWGQRIKLKSQQWHILSPYKTDTANMLAKYGLFAHPADNIFYIQYLEICF